MKKDKQYFAYGFYNANINQNYKFNKKFAEPQDEITDILLYARDLFDLREFKRCAFILKPYINTGN